MVGNYEAKIIYYSFAYYFRRNLSSFGIIAKCISNWQIIVQQVRCYSKILFVCMYVCTYVCTYIYMYIYIYIYGTAQFELEARVQVTCMYFVAPLEYFSKSCVSVDNCTRILRAIHAHVTSPNMLAYVRACTHITMYGRLHKEF